MPSDEDELREGLAAWRVEADPEEAFGRVSRKRRRRAAIRRVQVAALAVTVVAGTAVGTYALSRVFRQGTQRQPASIGQLGAVEERIAFVSDRDGNDEIYSMKPDGSDVRRLTNSPAHDVQPAWSPDGRSIAFISDRGGSHQIWVMGADGRNTRVLTGLPEVLPGSQISWTPASTIAFAGVPSTPPGGCIPQPCASVDYGLDILTVDPVHGTITDLIPYPLDQLQPAWGLGGTTLEFVGVSSAGTCVLGAAVRQGGMVRQGKAPNGGRCLQLNSYEPDTSEVTGRIAFRSGVHIYVWSSGLVRALTVGDDPSWSPDGSRIAFVRGSTVDGELFVMNADGTGVRQLTHSATGNNRQPAWSPPTGAIPIATPTPTPSPTPSPSPSDECSASETTVIANFDGNGQQDVAVVGPTGCLVTDRQPNDGFDTPFAIDVRWDGGPTEGIWPLPDCAEACKAYGAGDIDGNGTDELALAVQLHDPGLLLEILELPASELGPFAFPAQTEQGPGDPLLLAVSQGPRHVDLLTCQTAQSGDQQLFETAADLSADDSTWTLDEQVFGVIEQSFRVESNRTYTEPAGPGAPQAPGHECFATP